MTNFTRGDNGRRLQKAKNGIFGKVKPIHSRIKAVIDQPGADFLLAERPVFGSRALRSDLSQIDIDKIGTGHVGPFRVEKCNHIFCRAERIGQRESLAGWGIFIPWRAAVASWAISAPGP